MTFRPPLEKNSAGGRVASVASSGTEIQKLTLHEAQQLLPGTKRGGGCRSCSCLYDFILLVIRHV